MRALRPIALAAVATVSATLVLPAAAEESADPTRLAPARAAAPVSQPAAGAFASATIATADRPAPIPLAAATRGRNPAERAAASATIGVTMGDFFYDPETVTVSPGDTVTWTNVGEAPEGHTVTGDGFDSGVVEEGGTFSHRFDGSGTFDYICSLHDNMTGAVLVRGAGSGGAGGQGDDADGGETAAGGGNGGSAAGDDDGDTAGSSVSPGGAAAGASGSGGTGTGGSSAGGSSGSAGGGGLDGPLAYTGLNLILLLEIGIGLLASGYLVRRLLQA